MLFKIKSLRRRSTSTTKEDTKTPKPLPPNLALQPRISLTPPSPQDPSPTQISSTTKEARAVINSVHDEGEDQNGGGGGTGGEGQEGIDGGESENRDYEIFLAAARREEEKREEKLQRAIREADRRRREMNLDPWSKRW